MSDEPKALTKWPLQALVNYPADWSHFHLPRIPPNGTPNNWFVSFIICHQFRDSERVQWRLGAPIRVDSPATFDIPLALPTFRIQWTQQTPSGVSPSNQRGDTSIVGTSHTTRSQATAGSIDLMGCGVGTHKETSSPPSSCSLEDTGSAVSSQTGIFRLLPSGLETMLVPFSEKAACPSMILGR